MALKEERKRDEEVISFIKRKFDKNVSCVFLLFIMRYFVGFVTIFLKNDNANGDIRPCFFNANIVIIFLVDAKN